MQTPRIVLVLAAALLTPVSSAHAATTVGQAPPVEGFAGIVCTADSTQVSTAVTSGPDYRVPGPGVITAWQAYGDGPQVFYAMRAFTQQDSTHLTPVFDSGAREIGPGPNTFPMRFPVRGGELVGVRMPAGPDQDCGSQIASPGDTELFASPNPPLGGPVPFSPITSYRYNVAAIVEPDADGDGYGDETQDACPGESDDQCVPTTSIGKQHPPKRTKARTATFSFSADEKGVTFQCQLDKKPFDGCTSPVKYKKLKPRKHTFNVQSIDMAGVFGSIDTLKWRITGK